MNDLDLLRATTAIATAGELFRLSGPNRVLFRRKTAGWLDTAFFKVLSQLDLKGFIECGAHEAAASTRFATTFKRKAVAVEANPLTFAQKTKAATAHGVVAVNCGVASAPGDIDFFIPTSNQTTGNASTLRKPGEECTVTKVRALTLDELYLQHFAPGAKVALWIDVEGAGLDVLKSGTAVLSAGNCAALKIEVEAKAFWDQQALAGEVHEFLSGQGYVAVLRDIEYEDQCNLVYVHSSLVGALDEALLQCWGDLASLKLTHADTRRSPKESVARWKRNLTNSRFATIAHIAHRVAAMAGSQSSKDYLAGSR